MTGVVRSQERVPDVDVCVRGHPAEHGGALDQYDAAPGPRRSRRGAGPGGSAADNGHVALGENGDIARRFVDASAAYRHGRD